MLQGLVTNFFTSYGWGMKTPDPTAFRALSAALMTNVPIARMLAHAALDRHWKTKRMTRSEAYARLAKEMNIPASECHIAQFSPAQCKDVIRLTETWTQNA